ncbi:MAG: hypothetical protein MMC23_006063 [Stictis urceolatum]|nr:hypothetical protein [Stictis urceolata]
MAELAPVALHAMKVASENYDNIANTGKKGMEQIRRRRNKRNGDQEEYYYSRNTTSNTRAKSAGDYYDRDTRGRDSGRSRRDDDYYYDSYESEASIPPVNRRRGNSSQGDSQSRPTTQNGGVVSTRGGGRSRNDSSSHSSSSTSSSSEDLGSSTDDEKQEKKIRRGELITGGLAAVASVHAAGTVWGSMEARDAREEAVANGTLTKEEAKRERRKNQFQDVAALGLAALAIKGAYGKWKGTAAQHKNKKEHRQKKEERHAKRVEKGVDRESRRNGGSIAGGKDRRMIENGGGRGDERRDSRPSYNRSFSHSENDLTGGGYGGRGYEDYGRGGYDGYGDRYGRGRDPYDRYSRDV